MLWNIIDTGLERWLLSLDVRVSEISGVKVKKYEWIGPDLEDQGTYDNQLLSLWKNSSLQMYRLANANNIRYIHVLQPNQYTPNVKQFSEEEGAILGAWLHRDTISHIDQDSRILLAERTVFSLYPRLENEGQNLWILYGVPFIDATHIYDEESRTIYIDRCCHVNEVGSDMIVHLIVDALKKEY